VSLRPVQAKLGLCQKQNTNKMAGGGVAPVVEGLASMVEATGSISSAPNQPKTVRHYTGHSQQGTRTTSVWHPCIMGP
jgi:hypothetical protein